MLIFMVARCLDCPGMALLETKKIGLSEKAAFVMSNNKTWSPATPSRFVVSFKGVIDG